jgi:endonuclease/exonuclease/phosphatase family metal-dependent hydrolase
MTTVRLGDASVTIKARQSNQTVDGMAVGEKGRAELAYPKAEEIHRIIRQELAPHFAEWARCRSTSELLANSRYQSLQDSIRTVLESPEVGDFTTREAPSRDGYRVVAWNLERGIEFDGQLEVLRTHPYLKTADVLLLTETDCGMARSANRIVARELAQELGLHYAFVPCYLNLSKGAGLEHHADGENELGLHGNAVLSRYPIGQVRPVHLVNGIDKMAGREKRLGRQTSLVADIDFPNYRLTVASVHLDANSSQRHRARQLRDVIDGLDTRRPAVIGGDWNTTTYNSSSAGRAIMGFWLRVLMGVDNVIDNHYLHPYRWFEREMFRTLEARGFDYRDCNHIGEHTVSYDADDPKTRHNLGEWVPAWCFAFMRWALRNHGGKCPLKIDWFATRGVQCREPIVIHDVREGRAVPLSDHDAIGVDLVVLAPHAAVASAARRFV